MSHDEAPALDELRNEDLDPVTGGGGTPVSDIPGLGAIGPGPVGAPAQLQPRPFLGGPFQGYS